MLRMRVPTCEISMSLGFAKLWFLLVVYYSWPSEGSLGTWLSKLELNISKVMEKLVDFCMN